MSAKSEPSPNFSVRPPKDLLPRLQRLAADSNRSEAQVMLESVSAVIEMIEGGYDFVPPIVQRTRLWREFHSHGRAGMLGAGALSSDDKEKILPSECVRNLSPELIFLPVFEDIPDFETDLLTPYREITFWVKTEEYIGIPRAKCRGAHFGLRIVPGNVAEIHGSSGREGRIYFLATAEQLQRYNARYDPKKNLKLDQWEYFSKPHIRVAGWCEVEGETGQFLGTTGTRAKGDGVEEIVVWWGHGDTKCEVPLRDCNHLSKVVHSVPLSYGDAA